MSGKNTRTTEIIKIMGRRGEKENNEK